MGAAKEPVQENGDGPENGAATSSWTWGTAVSKAEELIRQHELPTPKRPASIGKEYDFPTNPRALDSVQLGALRLTLSAFHGYTLYLVGKEDVELEAFQTVYEMMLGDAMNAVQKEAGKRLVTDVLRAVTINNNETLKRLTRAITERRARVGMLRAHLAVYESHLTALSREQSRREMEARAGIV